MEKPPNKVAVARIVGLFGIHGELKCDPTAAGAPALAPQAIFEAVLPSGTRSLCVATIRPHARRLLVRFEGYDDATAAGVLIGAQLYAAADSVVITLGDDEYLDVDLIGCELVDPQGRGLGRVVEVAHYPAQDVLLVGTRRALVPLVRAFIKAVDVGAKRINVDLPRGLMDDREAEEA